MPYVTNGRTWTGSSASGEIIVTWSFAEANYPDMQQQYGGYPVFDTSIATSYRDEVQQAFQVWDDACRIKFIQVADSAQSDIRVANDYIDGAGSTLGICESWAQGGSMVASAIRIDEDAYSSVGKFLAVVTHEVGHAIGLGHSPSPSDLMHAYSDGQFTLSDDDIAGALSLYGQDLQFIMGTVASESLLGTAEADSIFGGMGADTIDGLGGDDLIFGGQGDFDDLIFAGIGDDKVFAGEGADTVYGGEGNDQLGGGQGADMIAGEAGNDTIWGGGGQYNDFIACGVGADVSFVGDGDDTVYGDDGADTIGGSSGSDFISGGRGDDVIYLGRGDASIDVYAASTSNGNDIVYAFEDGLDRIDLRAINVSQFSQLGIASSSGGNAVVIINPGETITLDGVSGGQIDANDFIFA